MDVRGDYEVTLLDIGGKDLLDDARTEATTFVDLYHPWDGTGPPPAERVEAWWWVIGARARRALSRSAIPEQRSPGEDG